MASDKSVRGKYLYLVVADALDFLRRRPVLAELEFEISELQRRNPDMQVPPEEHFAKTGILMGRLSTMAYTAIHNYELGDHNDRKAAAAARLAGKH
jgi:hypothetical protein